MRNGNGALVVARPSSPRHEVTLAFEAAQSAAVGERRHQEQLAADRRDADRRSAELAAKANEMARVTQRYASLLETVRNLHEQERKAAENVELTAAQKVISDAFTQSQISKAKADMIACVRELVGEGVDVERAVDADIRKAAEEVADRRGSHAKGQTRDENGKFAPEID